MKFPITFLLFIVIFQLSCVDQNEVTLDKMTGEWELVSELHRSLSFDAPYEETLGPTTHHRITIIKESSSTGIWRREHYFHSDSLPFYSIELPLEILKSGIECILGDSRIIGQRSIPYDVNFEGQNLKLTHEIGQFGTILILNPIE